MEHNIARMEMDNHADTCCFGSNFMPIYFTGQVCDVSPFMGTYKPTPDVQVASACTAYDDLQSGAITILEFHQGLWFGTKLTNSLISPNQCRAFGISICDDPYDPYRKLSIFDPLMDIEIPMQMSGTIVYVPTRVPMWQEIKDCPHIVMTDDREWDPSTIELRPSSKEEEEYSQIIASVRITDIDLMLIRANLKSDLRNMKWTWRVQSRHQQRLV